MSTTFDVHFDRLGYMPQYFNQYGYKVYLTHEDKTDWDKEFDDELDLHLLRSNENNLVFDFLPSMQKDGDLNPRIEVLPGQRLLKDVQYHASYEWRGVLTKNFRAIIFQIMDHDKDGKALPSLQWEIRDGKILARWQVIQDGVLKTTDVYSMAILEPSHWYRLELDFMLTSDPDKGYAQWTVMSDNGKIHKQFAKAKMVTASADDHGKPPQIQFGIYGRKGNHLRTEVRRLTLLQQTTI